MTHVSKHDGKEEGEKDDRKGARVDFAVAGDAVGVDEALEAGGELVGLEEGGRRLTGRHHGEDGAGCAARAGRGGRRRGERYSNRVRRGGGIMMAAEGSGARRAGE